MIRVEIIEVEREWGNLRPNEIKEFKTLEEAEAFITKFNSDNPGDLVSDWYLHARLAATV